VSIGPDHRPAPHRSGRDRPWRRRTALRLCCAPIVALLCALSGCGGARASEAPAVRVGGESISASAVHHWMSVLVGKGSNGKEPGPPVPVPPKYTACIADQRAHRRAPFAHTEPTDAQLKGYCEFEYERFKLKALYVLISHQWTLGEAANFGVKLDKRELQQQLSAFEQALAPSKAAFRRDLGFWRARPADILLSLEDEQLVTRIQAKIESGNRTPAQNSKAFARFGQAFRRKWVARTSCAAGYVVPICRNFKPPKEPAALVPPSIPLTDMPAGSGE
jgi:hypothetical protein